MTLPLAVAVLAAYAVLNALLYSAYLISGRHLLAGPTSTGA